MSAQLKSSNRYFISSFGYHGIMEKYIKINVLLRFYVGLHLQIE